MKQKHSNSQNFLHNVSLIDQLIRQSSILPEDSVVELGAGTGIITERLALRAKHILAIELDEFLLAQARRRCSTLQNITFLKEDIMKFKLPEKKPYKVFSNMPFTITRAVVDRLFLASNPPVDTYLIIQKEAAEKFAGVQKESLYYLLAKPEFSLEIVHHFKRRDFIPSPHVDARTTQNAEKKSTSYTRYRATLLSRLCSLLFYRMATYAMGKFMYSGNNEADV